MIPALNLTTLPRSLTCFPLRPSLSAKICSTVLTAAGPAVSFALGGLDGDDWAGGTPFPMTFTDGVKMIKGKVRFKDGLKKSFISEPGATST